MSKFYQLEANEWLSVCQELKPAEIKVLYRLRTLDPFGDRPIKFRVIDIAADLGMNKGTVSRAVQVLSEKGYINLEIVEAIATLTTKSKQLRTDNSLISSENSRLCTDNSVAYRQLERSLHNLNDRHTTSAIATQPDSLETLIQSASVFSHTIQTIHTDLDREDLKNFAESEEGNSAVTEVQAKEISGVLNQESSSQKKRVLEAGGSSRRALEDFILKSLGTEPRDRIAYFAKFTSESWVDWEAKFKAQSVVKHPCTHVFAPEIVEVASPEVALAAIASIKEILKNRKV